jgi:hypothetical protein
MADTAALVVALSAQLTRFEKDMEKAVTVANDNVKKIEDRFAKINPNVAPVVKNFEQAGSSSADAFVAGFLQKFTAAALVGGFVTSLNAIINTLAKVGDRAEELRLPVNLLQSLSLAAETARLPQEKLNAALDHFTAVSKKAKDDAEPFYTALRNIGKGFEDAFAKAPTQEARLKVVSNALAATSDEAKRATLQVAAFGTDSDKIFQLLGQGTPEIERAKAQLKALGLEIDEVAVQKAQEAKTQLNLLSAVLSDKFSVALAGLIPTLTFILPMMEQFASLVGQIFAAFEKAEARPVEALNKQIEALEKEIQQAQAAAEKIREGRRFEDKGLIDTWLGHLATEISGQTDDVALAANEERIARLTAQINELKAARDLGIAIRTGQSPAQGPPSAFKPRPGPAKAAAGGVDPFQSQVDSINRHIAALNADAAAVGKTAAAHEALRTEMALLQAVQRAGGPVTQAQIDKYAQLRATLDATTALRQAGINLGPAELKQFDELRIRIERVKAELDKTNQSFQGMHQAIQFAGNEFINIFQGLTNKTLTANDAMKQLTQTLVRALLQASLLGQGPLAGLLGFGTTVPGGTGGLLGALFSGFTPRQGGGSVSAGHGYIVGEHGPELFVPKSAGQIVPGNVSRQGMGAGYSVVVNNYTSGETETKQTRQQGPDGEMLVIDIVKRRMAAGDFDSVNRARFGVRAQKVR